MSKQIQTRWLSLIVLVLLACGPLGQAVATSAPTAPASAAQPAATHPAPSSTPAPTAVPPTPKIGAASASGLKQIGKIDFNNPYRLLWSLDSGTLAVMSNEQLTFLNGQSLINQGNIELKSPITLLDVSPDGHTLASTSDQATLTLRDARNGQTSLEIKPAAPFNSVAFAPDGKSLVTTSVDEISATQWDSASGKQLAQFKGFETAAPTYSVRFSNNGKQLVWQARAQLQIMDLANATFGPKFEHEDFIGAWALSDDGSLLATAAGGTLNGDYAPLLYLWDARSGKQLAQFKLPDVGGSLAFLPGGHLLAVGAGKQVILWDGDAQKQVATLDGHTDRITGLAFAPNGQSLATCASDNTLRLWQIKP